MGFTIEGGLYFLFLYLIETYRWRSVFPWLRFVEQTLLSHSILFSITCTSVTGEITEGSSVEASLPTAFSSGHRLIWWGGM